MRLRYVAWFLIALAVGITKGIDDPIENEYDSELQEESDITEAAIREESDYSQNDVVQALRYIYDDEALRQRIEEEDEEGGSVDDRLQIAQEEDSNEDDFEDHFSVLSTLNRLLRDLIKEHKLTTSSKKGKCSQFRSSSNAIAKKCFWKETMFGKIQACSLHCKAGYHLERLIPHYELCGAATKWRWSYQLKGKMRAAEKCLKGINNSSSPTSCTTSNCLATAAYYMDKIDYSVKPCDDFFDFACGRWMKETPMSPSKGKIYTYGVLRDRVKKIMAGLLGKPLNSSECIAVTKAKIVYSSCMDEKTIEQLDDKPLLQFLSNELTWPVINDTWNNSHFDLESTLATLRGKYHNNILFTLKVAKIGGTHILQTWKGKMALPTSYYFESRYASRKEAYFELMKDTAIMLGADKQTAEEDMRKVLAFETSLALKKLYDQDYFTLKSIAEMQRDIPGINWLRLFKNMIWTHPISSKTKVQVWNVVYLKHLIKTIQKTNSRIVQNYMVWRIVKHRIRNLSHRFEQRYLEYEQEMYGKRTLPARWYKCSTYVVLSMKKPTGKMYVDAHFSLSKKNAAETMFANIRHGFINLLDKEVKWMDKKTKSYAKEKALAMKGYFGYNPKVYENVTLLNGRLKYLVVNESDYFGNVIRVLTEISQNEFKTLGKKYNVSAHTESTARPTMVNAFYSPLHNSINIPAAEMQFPFYWGDKFPWMFQYGAIGTIIGHEMTHGFDNNGRKYDKHGNMRNWWSPKSLERFNKRTSCMVNQYSNFFWEKAGEFLNGGKTIGENIADNGGIRESYELHRSGHCIVFAFKDKGYQIWLKSKNLTGEANEPATGLTNNQMFFIGFANVRCAKYTTNKAIHEIAADVHSPGRYRVTGSLQNFDKFSEAFKCKSGSVMNPVKKCVIW